mgnify:CR=1 FL=1
MSNKDDINIDLFTSVSVIITPHENGFSLGIIDSKPDSERDIATYIAKGMVKMAIDQPDVLYEKGVMAFESSILEPNGQDDTDNVFDLIEFKNKKDLH